jgi:hypothetical protein
MTHCSGGSTVVAGDVVQVEEPHYKYGTGTLLLRVTGWSGRGETGVRRGCN